MIQNLCNLFEDSNFDTFYKISVIETSRLPYFNHLTRDTTILSLVNSLPPDFQAMVIPFLPEKFTVESGTRINNHNQIHRHRITFPLLPQDKAIKDLLDTYNNREVIAFVNKMNHSHLYGTKAQPLVFSYSELNATGPAGIKGFTLTMQGESYAGPKYFKGQESDFPVVQRGLAFKLAGRL